MNKIIKNTLILTVITVVSGLLLGIVYDITKEPIAAAQENSKQEAYRTVLPDADSFENYENFDAEEAAALVKDNGYTDDITEVAAGKSDSGETVGYVLNVTSHSGYGGDIEISVGILNDGTISGMKADEAEFKDQFKDKNVEKFSYTKNGASADNEIDAISGATITTSAVTDAVNSALVYFQNELGGGSNE